MIPVFVCDDTVEALGAASKWRLGLSVENLSAALADKGARLILRRGKALTVLRKLIDETGAGAVYWLRLYDSASKARDTEVKAALKDDGIDARSFAGHLLFEPWTVETQDGGFYKVYSPMWRAVRGRDPGTPLNAPGTLPVPGDWPASDDLDDWALGSAMRRGAEIVEPHQTVGEDAARDRLYRFADEYIGRYKAERDFPARPVTSGLSENLTYGEISPRVIWQAGHRAMDEGEQGAEHFLKELVWREFAYHLIHHTPRIESENWRDGWDGFPWRDDNDGAERWRRGRTGVPLVDAGMREMYVTGTMHNRVRMIVASYLTKHLMTHWRVGQKWFEDCLTDWDPASNAMGWQWVAGCGPDAAPYFRVFNPDTQAEKFDPDGTYIRRWLAEGHRDPTETAKSYFNAIPKAWGMSLNDPYPDPVVTLKDGRKAALDAYEAWKS